MCVHVLCSALSPSRQSKIYVMYISMDNEKDFDNWMKLATVSCDIVKYNIIYYYDVLSVWRSREIEGMLC